MPGWSRLVSMELDDEDKMDFCAPMPCDRPDYPYGLRICFSEKELEKLKLGIPENGDMIDLRVFGQVTCVSTEQRDGKETCRVEIQIQYVGDAENEMKE